MSGEGSVTMDIQNYTGTIEFYHPKGNSLPGALLKKLADTISEADTNPDVRVIVLKSAGTGAFCAGASFDELIAIEDYDTGKAFFSGFAHVINAMRSASKLIIVRVHGKTVGGGVGIAAAGDYTFGTAGASVKLSELALGIGPFVISPAVERKIGTTAFATLSIDATSWYSAEWARKQGLFNRFFETTADMDKAINALTTQLAQSSPEAMSEIKSVLWKGTETWPGLLEQRAEISGRLVLSEYTKSFIRKFKQK